MASQSSSPPRRRLRFSLRTFLIFVVVLAFPLGWIGKQLEGFRRQHTAIVELRTIGCRVGVKAHFDSAPEYLLPLLEKLDSMVGGEGMVVAKYAWWDGKGTAPTDDQLVLLLRLPMIEYLEVNGAKLTDASCKTLAKLNQLESLTLSNAPFSAAGIAELAHCPALHSLSLEGSSATNDNLAGLAQHAELKALWIYAGDINDSALQPIKRMGKLRKLSLIMTPGVTGEFLQWLPSPDQFRELELKQAPISDSAMAYVAKMKNLESLELYKTNVTDVGVKLLGKLPALETLSLHGSNISDKGVPKLIANPALGGVDLRGTSVADETINSISKLNELWSLNLCNTKITDIGVRKLRDCKQLMNLDIGPDVSLDAVKELKAAIPACSINLVGADGHACTVEP